MTGSSYFFKQLSEDIDVSTFMCGKEWWETDVSDFLKTKALKEQAQGCNKTWLCYSPDNMLLGYTSLVSSSIRFKFSDEYRPDILEQIEREYFPCVLIGQFGVDFRYQNKHIGQFMFDWVLGVVAQTMIGVKYLTVDVEYPNERGRIFWEKQGFDLSKKVTPDKPIHLAYDIYSSSKGD